MAKVSIIMGIYNGANTMDEAIKSICSQSYTDWELIICDDCSQDETLEKAQKWQSEEPRIKVIKNEKNTGLAAALNHCFQYSTGEYIARMDDDDISYKNRIQMQVDFLDNYCEYGFVSSVVDCYDGSEIVRNRFWRKEKPEKRDFLKGTQFVHPATMFRRQCLEAVGGYRDIKMTQRTEDYDLFMRLYAIGYLGYNIQIPLLRYTINIKAMKDKVEYKHRINEAKVRFYGFRELGLLPFGFIFIFRPLIVGLIPKKLIWKLFYKN